jgi:hypothetical protein
MEHRNPVLPSGTPESAPEPSNPDPWEPEPSNPDPWEPSDPERRPRDGAGLGADGARTQAPTRRGVPSVRPALIVVGIAAGLVLLFGIGAALTSSSTPPKPRSSALAPVKGTALRAEAATSVLRPIERPDTPPPDVLRSVVVPEGSTTVSSKPWDGSTQFSGEMTFRLQASQAAVVDFYRAELKARGWSISSVGAAEGKKNATEVLAQRASTDGWYWEIGVVVSPTTFTSPSRPSSDSGAAGSTGADSTQFSLDLFQEPETG